MKKIPFNWAVKNDWSQLFKDTVIKYINENKNYNYDYIWNDVGDFYWYNWIYFVDDTVSNNIEILTLDEFIELTKEDEVEIEDLETDNIFLEFENLARKCIETIKSKNQDYSWSDDFFKNFKIIENFTNWQITTEEWILVRLSDKFSRISNLLTSKNEIQVKDEKVEDTIRDMICYLMILHTYLENKK